MKFIPTNIGRIAVYSNTMESHKTPIMFLHGVYFDHHMWDYFVHEIKDHNIITIDMPLHGVSREITKTNWTLNDCADMLIEIMDSLQIQKVIAIGHSWGSMTILRAATKCPQRFESIGLCNMPFCAATPKQKWIFKLQHTLLFFRHFYTKQTSKSLFGKASLKKNQGLIGQLKRPMDILTNGQVRAIDKHVIIDADDATPFIHALKVKAMALKGREDYVPSPPKIETVLIEGGHISPLEQSSEVLTFIQLVINYKAV